ncbi:MAG: glycosyltransferase [Crocinitomicaceae bacterium]|nr:glycosyltransferase [Crocinitomicaceae bacterium]
MVSILMPFYNMERWIQETVHSIQSQTFKDWELICIDDFSTDQSNQLIKNLQSKDERIQLYRNTSKGIIPALNLALKKSSGKYITRMDADDFMPQERLKKMVSTLSQSSEKTIVTGKVQYFSREPVSNGYREYENWLNQRVDNNDHWKHIFRECVIASPNWIVRKSDLIKHEIFDTLKYPEDYDMTFQWMKKGFSITSIACTTLLWREHPDRTSRNSLIYQQNSFFQLKLDWFLKIHGTEKKTIGILGAGTKGKITARFLTKHAQNFNWYDYKHSNYSAGLQGHKICDYNDVSTDLLLIAIYPKDLDKLTRFLSQKGYKIGKNAWLL